MRYVFVAIAPADIAVAIFWDHEAALQFARSENDSVQAEIIEIDQIPLIDIYGYPCQITDLPLIAPWTTG